MDDGSPWRDGRMMRRTLSASGVRSAGVGHAPARRGRACAGSAARQPRRPLPPGKAWPTRLTQALLLAGVLTVGVPATGDAQTARPGAPALAAAAPALAPEAEAALRRLSATLVATPAFTVRMTSLRDAVLANGQPVLLSASGLAAVRRPGRLATAFGSDLGNFAAWYDGAPGVGAPGHPGARPVYEPYRLPGVAAAPVPVYPGLGFAAGYAAGTSASP